MYKSCDTPPDPCCYCTRALGSLMVWKMYSGMAQRLATIRALLHWSLSLRTFVSVTIKTLYHTATVYNNMLHNEHSHSTDLILTFHIDFGGFLYVLIHYVFRLLLIQHGEGMDKHRLLKLRTLIKRNMRWGLIHKHLSSIVNHEIKLFIK